MLHSLIFLKPIYNKNEKEELKEGRMNEGGVWNWKTKNNMQLCDFKSESHQI